MSMFRYCEKGWKWLFLTMIALCRNAATIRTIFGVLLYGGPFDGRSLVEGSAAIQIEGPVAPGCAEIKDGVLGARSRLNESDGREEEHRTEFRTSGNILDVYTREYRERGNVRRPSFEFLGGEPQVLVLTQFSASSTNDPPRRGACDGLGGLPEKKRLMRILFTSATSLRSITAPCAFFVLLRQNAPCGALRPSLHSV